MLARLVNLRSGGIATVWGNGRWWGINLGEAKSTFCDDNKVSCEWENGALKNAVHSRRVHSFSEVGYTTCFNCNKVISGLCVRKHLTCRVLIQDLDLKPNL